MARIVLTGLILMFSAAVAAAQEAPPPDSTLTPVPTPPPVAAPAVTAQPAPVAAPAVTAQPAPVPAPQSSLSDRMYYGGTVTLSFGSVTRIGVAPMVAYKVTPKLSLGGEVSYEFVDYRDFNESSSNYGGSVFSRYRLVPQLYAHAEYQMINYEVFEFNGSSSRQTVPFLLVGGGVVKSLGARTSAYAEVLFDVLQDDNSPYDDWDPVFSFGVGVGF